MEPDIIIVSRGEMSPEEKEMVIVRTQLFSALRTLNKYDDIEIRKTDGKVVGVFANKYIEERTILTRFPAHYFCEFKSENEFNPHPSNIVKSKGFMFVDECHGCTFRINEKYGISGDPRINDDTRFAGHLIREKTQLFSQENCEYNEDQERLYNEHHMPQNTAITFYDNDLSHGVFVVAMRDIAAGEELFVQNEYEYVREYSKVFHKKK